MTVAPFIKFLVGVAAATVVAHLSSAVVVTAGLYALYPHRIFDVRRWSDDSIASLRLVGTYLNSNARRVNRPLIGFAGSSVTFGHLWHDRMIFSRLFADRHADATILNVSIIAADISGVNDWIVCAAKRNAITFDVLVVELPVVNSLSYLIAHRHAGTPPPPLRTCETGDADPGYLWFAASTVRGMGWLRFLWNSEGRARDERQITIEPVPKGYFASAADFAAVSGSLSDRIVTTLNNAKAVAKVVYAFPSPVFVAGLRQIGEDDRAVDDQLRAALTACASVREVHCIDPSALYSQPAYYYNFTHLNQAGHRAMADLLDAQVAVR